MRVGVFICQCGGNISNTVDVEEVKNAILETCYVHSSEITSFLCSKQGLDLVKEAIAKKGLDRVVIASCSPHMHEKTFREAIFESELNQHLLEHVNIREQCSWVHKDRKKATEKAIALIKGGVMRAANLYPLEELSQPVSRKALILGGGIAGITAALLIADTGYPVILVERRSYIGGHMTQLSKTFPTLDCAPCILSPRISDVAKHSNIELLTNSELTSLIGSIGQFQASIRCNPRFVDTDRCVTCGRCVEVCPVSVPNEYEEEIYERRAIYRAFPEAIPAAYVIDPASCKQCGACVKVCPSEAISLDKKPNEVKRDIGVIVVATGFDLADISENPRYSSRHPDVITALQMERLMINELGSGRVLRRDNGRRVKKLAFVLCTGSRDPHNGVPYCSRVCCPYVIKQAVLLKKTLPYLSIWIYYTDIRMSGRGFEEFYRTARELGIVFVKGKPGEITADQEEDAPIIFVEDQVSGYLVRNRLDMVVLCPAMLPSEGTEELSKILQIPRGPDKFIAERHPKLSPVSTYRSGVFAAGTCLGPKDIHDSVTDGRAAAGLALGILSRDEIIIDAVHPTISEPLCDGCGLCIQVCTAGAISLLNRKAKLDSVTCDICGLCVHSCPKGAIEVPNYNRDQILAQVKGILGEERPTPQIIGFFQDEVAYSALDSVGVARLEYPTEINIIRVPSTTLIETDDILACLGYGADAILLYDRQDSPAAEATTKKLTEIWDRLEKQGIDRQRVACQNILLPLYRMLPEYLKSYVTKIKRIGVLDENSRRRILQQLEGR